MCFKLIYRKFWWHHHLILLLASRGLMASCNTIPGESASALQNCRMLYVHCISKENFITWPRDLSCMELVCWEVHASFLDKMAERRVALLPASNGRHNVDVLFASESIPALVSLKTSCNCTVRMIVIVQKQGKIFAQIVIKHLCSPFVSQFL